MKITTIGIDLAESVFQVHGVDERGKAVLRKQLKRAEVGQVLCQCAGVPGGDGSLRQRALLGQEAH
jgi:hypothetical protein